MKEWRLKKKQEAVIIKTYIDDIYLRCEYTQTSSSSESEEEVKLLVKRKPNLFSKCTNEAIRLFKNRNKKKMRKVDKVIFNAQYNSTVVWGKLEGY